MRHASVGDDDVQSAELVNGAVDHLLSSVDRSCICLNGECVFVPDLLNEFLGTFRVGRVVDDYRCASFNEREACCPADAFGASGDEGHFTIQCRHVELIGDGTEGVCKDATIV